MLLPSLSGRALRRTVAISTALFLTTAIPSQAQHKARLSSDLEKHLENGSQQISVIVNGDRQTADNLARRYSLVIKKYLKDGAVIQMTAGQLAAVQQDETQDHLSS